MIPNKEKQILKRYWDAIGSELVQMVQDIENKPLTTQNHYGNYMHLLTVLIGEGMDKSVCALLLLKANANPQGVKSALKCLGDY